jgi:hypothetical protein
VTRGVDREQLFIDMAELETQCRNFTTFAEPLISCWKNAAAIFKALTESNCSLTWLNLKRNAEISQRLQSDVDFVLAPCQVLKSFCDHLCKPPDKKLIPFVISGLQLSSVCRENPELVRSQETRTGLYSFL